MSNRSSEPQCPACWGKPCKGGGNKLCVKRDSKPSHLAGILDRYGGLRFIVAHKASFKHHVRCDETLIVVPNLLVHLPIAWDDIPHVIGRIEAEVEVWIGRGLPNYPDQLQAVKMYQLRCLEHNRRALNLEHIVET